MRKEIVWDFRLKISLYYERILLNTAAKQNSKLSKKKMIKKMMWNESYFLEIIAQIIKILSKNKG
jgi:hypothetical protein